MEQVMITVATKASLLTKLWILLVITGFLIDKGSHVLAQQPSPSWTSVAIPVSMSPAESPAVVDNSCNFLKTGARYYQVKSMLTLQNVDTTNVFINDGLIRTLRSQLLLGECQMSMSEGTTCESGTPGLPCAEPVYECMYQGRMTTITGDIYEAIKESSCIVNGTSGVGQKNTLVCDSIFADPSMTQAVEQGNCVSTCPPSTNNGSLTTNLDRCLSFQLMIDIPTEEAAKMLMNRLTSPAMADVVTFTLTQVGDGPVVFQVVNSEIDTAVGFGFFPPPPPPVKALLPASSVDGAIGVTNGKNGTQLEYGPWTACFPPCGEGIKTRTARCLDLNGNMLPLMQCASQNVTTSQNCRNSCNMPYWDYSPWRTCNATCGGGVSLREATCVSNGTSCDESSKNSLSRQCNTLSCNVHSWVVSEWSMCSEQCGGGTQSRNVTCVNSSGSKVQEDLCQISEMPANSQECSSHPCNFCSNNTCLGRGTCKQEACQCSKDYSGNRCEVHASCKSGVVDAKLECCDSGVVDKNGKCCDMGSQLDGDGQCCSGQVNACGVCAGPNAYLDMQGTCCQVIDADGVCCESQNLDECGVCNGVGDTCNIRMSVRMEIPSSIISGDSIQDQSIATYLNAVANASGFSYGSVSVGNIALAPKQGRRRLVQETVSVIVEVEMSPDGNNNSTYPFSAAYVAATLPNASSQVSGNGMTVQEVPMAGRSGLCGNGICEVGERSIGSTTSGTCPEDCGLPSIDCPGENGSCNSHGTCMPSSGICVCFDGYSGASCETCSDGFVTSTTENDTICVSDVAALGLISPTVLSSSGDALVSGESGGGTSAGVIVGAVLGSILGVALVVLVIIFIRKRYSMPSARPAIHDNKYTYPSSDSDDVALRKKYGVDTYHFGYDSEDTSGKIQASLGLSAENPRWSSENGEKDEHIMQHKGTHTLPGVAEIVGDDLDNPNPLIHRPLSAQVSYVHNDPRACTTLHSSEQISGYQEALYVKQSYTDDSDFGMSKKGQHAVTRHGETILSGLHIEIPNDEEMDYQTEGSVRECEDLGALSLDHSEVHKVDKKSNDQKNACSAADETGVTVTTLDKSARLYFNPAFSMRSADQSFTQQHGTIDEASEKSANVLQLSGEASSSDMEERKRQLDALRAAVHSLEQKSGAIYQHSSRGNSQENDFDPEAQVTRMSPPIDQQDLNVGNIPSRHNEGGIRNFFASVSRALTPPRFRSRVEDVRGKSGEQSSQKPNERSAEPSDSSFHRVLAAVDGALGHSAKSSPVKRSWFNAQLHR